MENREHIAITRFDAKERQAWERLHALAFEGEADAAKLRPHVLDWLDENPAPGTLHLAAHIDGVLVGYVGLMARRLTLTVGAGRDLRGLLAVVAMSHPEYRGRGIYSRLVRAAWQATADASFDFCAGYTVRPTVLAMELKIGWERVSEGRVLALPLRFGDLARHRLAWLGPLATALSPLDALQRFHLRARSTLLGSRDLCIQRARVFSEDFDALDDAVRRSNGGQLCFAKDRATLAWQYLSAHNPFRDSYEIFEARLGRELVAAVVGRPMDMLGLRGYALCELLAHPKTSRAHLAQLVMTALSETAVSAGRDIAAALVSPQGQWASALASLGFLPAPQRFAWIYHGARPGLPDELRQADAWVHAWGNADTI